MKNHPVCVLLGYSTHEMPKFPNTCLTISACLGWFFLRLWLRHSLHPQTAVSANTDAVSGKILGSCVSSSPERKKTNVYIATSKSQRQAPYIHISDIGKVPSLKICLSIFDETTGKQQLMMALLKIGYDWAHKDIKQQAISKNQIHQ